MPSSGQKSIERSGLQLPRDLEEALCARRMPALDAIRAFAVLSVMLMHFGIHWARGVYGVVAFFVLSGFLITWLLLQERARSGCISLSAFYTRRALRIFPAFYVYVTITIALLVATAKPINWPHVISAILYCSNYYAAVYPDPNDAFSHTWSLAIEEQFYLLWPLALLMLIRRGIRVDVALGCAIVGVWLYRPTLVYAFHVDQAWIYGAFETRVDALLVGCLTAVLLFERRIPKVWKFLTSNSCMPLLTFVVLSLVIGPRVPRSELFRDVFGFAIAPPLIAILIVQCLALSKKREWAWLEWRWLSYVGQISYGIYLYQQLTIDYATRHPVGAAWVTLPIAIALTVLLASASYWLVEKPFLRFKRRFSRVSNGSEPIHSAP